MRLVLASQSPRRAELLDQMALNFEVVVTDIDESQISGEIAPDYVGRLACEKAAAGLVMAAGAGGSVVVLGADTVVVLEARGGSTMGQPDEILGKPRSPKEGKEMLRRLSGRDHLVHTGIAVTDGQRTESRVVSSRVFFRVLSDDEIESYWQTGEGLDKAGSYGIQGIGGILVERIEGSFSGVMGLPVTETEALLQSLDVDTWSMRNQWLKNSS
ncbi:MAG: septum formation protein [Limisphaerales bacterium]|jgi:septum formation protein